jgi:SAM-dependent methyltransferase
VQPTDGVPPSAEAYQRLGALYDEWCRGVEDDLGLYRAFCAGAGRVVELGVGSGRVAVELCRIGLRVTGIDAAPAMLERARARALAAGVGDRLELVQADIRSLPALAPAPRVIVPFRTLMHMRGDAERLAALRGARALLTEDGELAFDVFSPSGADVRETDGRWLEREPGIRERARWDTARQAIELEVDVRGTRVAMRLEWRTAREWRALCAAAGLRVSEAFDGFHGAPLTGGAGDHVFVCAPTGGGPSALS